MTADEQDEVVAQECVAMLTDTLLSLFAAGRGSSRATAMPEDAEVRDVIVRVFTPAFRNQVKILRRRGREELRTLMLSNLGEVVDSLASRLSTPT